MWEAKGALPQRQRRVGKQGKGIEQIDANTACPEKEPRDVAEQNSQLRSSAEPGCSYECEHGQKGLLAFGIRKLVSLKC